MGLLSIKETRVDVDGESVRVLQKNRTELKRLSSRDLVVQLNDLDRVKDLQSILLLEVGEHMLDELNSVFDENSFKKRQEAILSMLNMNFLVNKTVRIKRGKNIVRTIFTYTSPNDIKKELLIGWIDERFKETVEDRRSIYKQTYFLVLTDD